MYSLVSMLKCRGTNKEFFLPVCEELHPNGDTRQQNILSSMKSCHKKDEVSTKIKSNKDNIINNLNVIYSAIYIHEIHESISPTNGTGPHKDKDQL